MPNGSPSALMTRKELAVISLFFFNSLKILPSFIFQGCIPQPRISKRKQRIKMKKEVNLFHFSRFTKNLGGNFLYNLSTQLRQIR
jgi:hypothetical protein